MRLIWVDVEHLFQHAAACPRPSGIQRLSFEIYQALVVRFGTDGPVRFVRQAAPEAGFAEIAWGDVAALYDRMVAGRMVAGRMVAGRMVAGPPVADGDAGGGDAGRGEDGAPPAPLPVPAAPLRPRSAVRRMLRRASERLPDHVRTPLAAAAGLQRDSWMAAARALRAAILGPGEPAAAAPADSAAAGPPEPAVSVDAFAGRAGPGDVLLSIGAPWWQGDYVDLVAEVRRRHGLALALLVYDLIPVREPEWCDPHLVAIFTGWLQGILPQCDAVMAISQATADDVRRYATERGIALPGPVRTIPIGTGFGKPAVAPARPPARALPPAGSYALFVSTIEGRKNHALLVRVWRRLLADLPAARVPTLVFAGRIGSLVSDLLGQLVNTGRLGGRVVIVEDPSDAELETLYRGCLFTLFPSFAEGWGLPVTESLAFGKPCVIADGSSLPEAGGALARYFDPDDVNDAHRVIRGVIEDQEGLAAWTARVRREFRPVPWDAAAVALVRALAPELLLEVTAD